MSWGKDKVTVLVESYRFYFIKLPFWVQSDRFSLGQSYRLFWDRVTVLEEKPTGQTVINWRNGNFHHNSHFLKDMVTLRQQNGNFIRTRVTVYFQRKSKTVTFGNKR